jgi:hypothetical protein
VTSSWTRGCRQGNARAAAARKPGQTVSAPAHGARRYARIGEQACLDRVEIGEHLLRTLVIDAASLGQRQRAGGADDKARADALFKRGEAATDGWQRQSAGAGGARETPNLHSLRDDRKSPDHESDGADRRARSRRRRRRACPFSLARHLGLGRLGARRRLKRPLRHGRLSPRLSRRPGHLRQLAAFRRL